MKRAVLAIVGAFLIVVGIGIGGAGGTLAFLSGPDGVVSADAGRISGNGYALVFNEFTINTVGDPATVRQFAEFELSAASQSGNDVFMGIGPAAQVNEYLELSARDIVSDLSDGTARVIPIPGKSVPASPSEQKFWTAQAQGADPTISLAQSGDNQTLVIMNAVPEPQVTVNVTLGLTSGAIFPVGLGLLILGVLFLVLGIWSLWRAVRPRRPADLPPSDGASPGASIAEYQHDAQVVVTDPAPETVVLPVPDHAEASSPPKQG
ncbi:MAG: hypothetical protein WBZ04_07190 [Candidatus Nanopelagicales bacterium]|jgi:hypothetical protein